MVGFDWELEHQAEDLLKLNSRHEPLRNESWRTASWEDVAATIRAAEAAVPDDYERGPQPRRAFGRFDLIYTHHSALGASDRWPKDDAPPPHRSQQQPVSVFAGQSAVGYPRTTGPVAIVVGIPCELPGCTNWRIRSKRGPIPKTCGDAHRTAASRQRRLAVTSCRPR
jgi:hypothetical protein